MLGVNLGYTQIAGNQQKAVDTVRVILNFRIDHIGIHISGNTLVSQQSVEIFSNFRCGRRNYLTQSVIAAGGLPEGLWHAVVRNIVNDRPGIENFRFSELVTVIPVADLLILLAGIVIGQHIFYLILGETKIPAVSIIQQGVDLQVIQAAEDALLGNSQNTGQEAIGQILVVLQTAGEKITHEIDDFLVKI